MRVVSIGAGNGASGAIAVSPAAGRSTPTTQNAGARQVRQTRQQGRRVPVAASTLNNDVVMTALPAETASFSANSAQSANPPRQTQRTQPVAGAQPVQNGLQQLRRPVSLFGEIIRPVFE